MIGDRIWALIRAPDNDKSQTAAKGSDSNDNEGLC